MAIPFSPIAIPLSVTRGDTHPFSIAVTRQLEDGTIEPFDLTGCVLVLTVDPVENPADDSGNVLEITATLDGDPTTGLAEFQIADADWVGVLAGSYFYDVELTNADGDTLTILKSTFAIPQDITKN